MLDYQLQLVAEQLIPLTYWMIRNSPTIFTLVIVLALILISVQGGEDAITNLLYGVVLAIVVGSIGWLAYKNIVTGGDYTTLLLSISLLFMSLTFMLTTLKK